MHRRAPLGVAAAALRQARGGPCTAALGPRAAGSLSRSRRATTVASSDSRASYDLRFEPAPRSRGPRSLDGPDVRSLLLSVAQSDSPAADAANSFSTSRFLSFGGGPFAHRVDRVGPRPRRPRPARVIDELVKRHGERRRRGQRSPRRCHGEHVQVDDVGQRSSRAVPRSDGQHVDGAMAGCVDTQLKLGGPRSDARRIKCAVSRPETVTWPRGRHGVGAAVGGALTLRFAAAHARGVKRPGFSLMSSSLARSIETRYSCTGTPAATAV